MNSLLEDLEFDVQKFVGFTQELNNGYLDNPYHNNLHAFDVTQTVHYFLSTCQFTQKADLPEIEIAAIYIACAGHDLGHP